MKKCLKNIEENGITKIDLKHGIEKQIIIIEKSKRFTLTWKNSEHRSNSVISVM